ncbi:MAG: DNA polymerase III subunit delta [Spirochaetia bacterium]|nr:DNA polymerase III subunit delta [Spirochaetia bacterium]
MIIKTAEELIAKIIKSAQLPNIIIVSGNQIEPFEVIYKAIVKKFEEFYPGADVVSLNGTETDASVFHSELATIPMFETGRLILLRHADNLLKKIDANKTILSYFTRDFAGIYEKTILVMQLEAAKVPASLNIMMDKAWFFEQEKPRARDIPEIIKTRVHKMGFEIDDDALSEMTNKYSLNPTLLYQALDRLLLCCLNEKKISREDVREAAFDVEGDLAFDIIDALAERNLPKAIKLFENNEFTNGVYFGSLINRFFTDLFRYQKLKNAGIEIKEIHERLDLNTKHAFIFRKNNEKFHNASMNYSADEIIVTLDKLFELDKNMKENNAMQLQKNIIIVFMASLEKKAI